MWFTETALGSPIPPTCLGAGDPDIGVTRVTALLIPITAGLAIPVTAARVMPVEPARCTTATAAAILDLIDPEAVRVASGQGAEATWR